MCNPMMLSVASAGENLLKSKQAADAQNKAVRANYYAANLAEKHGNSTRQYGSL